MITREKRFGDFARGFHHGILAARRWLDFRIRGPDAARFLSVVATRAFTDIGLPGRDGCSLAAEAQRRRPDLNVLFTAGYDAGASIRGGRHKPDDPIIDKPFTADDLARKIGQVIGAAAISGEATATGAGRPVA